MKLTKINDLDRYILNKWDDDIKMIILTCKNGKNL